MQSERHSLVIVENTIPLADSREIAQALGIEHESFYGMIKKYQGEIEKDFGHLRFQIGVGSRRQGGGNPMKYALLTEDQTYAYMAYSQNTAQARRCKRLLVKAFSEARQRLVQGALEGNDALAALIETVESGKLDLLITQLQRLQTHVSLAPVRISGQSPVILKEERTQWETFLCMWYWTYGEKWMSVAAMVRSMVAFNDAGGGEEHRENGLEKTLPETLQLALKEKPQSFKVRLGKALDKRVGVYFGEENCRLEKTRDTHSKTCLWHVFCGGCGVLLPSYAK